MVVEGVGRECEYHPTLLRPERLPGTAAVTSFLRRHRMLGPNTVGERDVAELHQLRTRIRRVFAAGGEPAAIAELNALLADAGITPWIARTPAGREIFFAPQTPRWPAASPATPAWAWP